MDKPRDLRALFSIHKEKLKIYIRANEKKRLATELYNQKYAEYQELLTTHETQKKAKVVLEKACQSYAERIKSILEQEIQNGVISSYV